MESREPMSSLRITLKRCVSLVLVLVFSSDVLWLGPQAQAAAYDAHPKVVVILVIDQFRADYLERYRADFKARGFRLFLDHGAYFPDCYYGYANTKTAPGHATIGTGAYTDGHGIGSNEWWDLSRNQQRPVSSVEDERYALVGLPAPGASVANQSVAGTQAPAQAQAGAQAGAASRVAVPASALRRPMMGVEKVMGRVRSLSGWKLMPLVRRARRMPQVAQRGNGPEAASTSLGRALSLWERVG